MNIFGIGLPEMGLIMIVALLVFGPKKLPEISRSLGGAIRDLQKASKEFEEEFKKEADAIEKTVVEPMKATLEKPKAISEGKSDANAANGEPKEAEIVEAATPEATTEVETTDSSVAEAEVTEDNKQTA